MLFTEDAPAASPTLQPGHFLRSLPKRKQARDKKSIVQPPKPIQFPETRSGDPLFERLFLATFLIASVALASAQAPTAPGKPLPPGPVLPKIKAACTQCHDTGRISEQHLARQDLMRRIGIGMEQADRDRVSAAASRRAAHAL